METEIEPAHTVSNANHPGIDLLVSARASYSAFSCNTTEINFTDTLLMQTRVYESVYVVLLLQFNFCLTVSVFTNVHQIEYIV